MKALHLETSATFALDLPILSRYILLILATVAYTWLYEGWLSGSDYPGDDAPHPQKLSRRAERIRWTTAFVLIVVVFLETYYSGASSWGLLIALLITARAYFRDNFVTSPLGGGYELSANQQAERRRYAILPAAMVLLVGTDFHHGQLVNAIILVIATFAFVIIVLVPEPAE